MERSSSDFFAACEKVVLRLNIAGFSKKDYRAKEDEYGDVENNRADDRVETNLNICDMAGFAGENVKTGDESKLNIDVEALKVSLIKLTENEKSAETDGYEKVFYAESDHNTTLMVKEAEMQNEAYWEELNQQENDAYEGISENVVSKIGTYAMKLHYWKRKIFI